MAGSRVGLFDNLNIPIHRDAQHREDHEIRDDRTTGTARASKSRLALHYPHTPHTPRARAPARTRPRHAVRLV